MVSTFEILSEVYKAINVAGVKDIISGKVYIGFEPNNDQNENIVIGMVNNPGNYVQAGIININTYAKGVDNGRPDLKNLDRMVKAIYPIIDDTTINVSGTRSVHLSINDDKGPFEDQDNKGKFFQNIRIDYVTL